MKASAKQAARRRVVESWSNTLFSLMVFTSLVVLAFAAAASHGMSDVVVTFIESAVALGITFFLISEMVVLIMLSGRLASRAEFPELHAIMDELLAGRKWFRPRLWIVTMPKEMPNAVAFGPGLFGWSSIAVTESLIKLVDRDELKAIVAHELGHVRSRDTGVLTMVTLLTNGMKMVGKSFRSNANIYLKLIGFAFWPVEKFIIPIGQASISQQREYAADALSAIYCGTARPMISALRKLDNELTRLMKGKRNGEGLLSDLYTSHPGMDRRIAALEELEALGYTHQEPQSP